MRLRARGAIPESVRHVDQSPPGAVDSASALRRGCMVLSALRGPLWRHPRRSEPVPWSATVSSRPGWYRPTLRVRYPETAQLTEDCCLGRNAAYCRHVAGSVAAQPSARWDCGYRPAQEQTTPRHAGSQGRRCRFWRPTFGEFPHRVEPDPLLGHALATVQPCLGQLAIRRRRWIVRQTPPAVTGEADRDGRTRHHLN